MRASGAASNVRCGPVAHKSRKKRAPALLPRGPACLRSPRCKRRLLLSVTPLGWRGGLGRGPSRGAPRSGGVHPATEIRRRPGGARLRLCAARPGLRCACSRGLSRRRLRPLRLEASTLVGAHGSPDADFHFLRDILLHLPEQIVLARTPDDRAVTERPEGTVFDAGDVRVVHARRWCYRNGAAGRGTSRGQFGPDLNSPGKHRHGGLRQRKSTIVNLSRGRRSLDQHEREEEWSCHAEPPRLMPR